MKKIKKTTQTFFKYSLYILIFLVLGLCIYILGSKLNTNNIIKLDKRSSVELELNERFSVAIDFKPSTGYSPFPPIYDNSVLELVSYTDDESSNGLLGGDKTVRTYIFKATKKSSNSKLELGIYRTWEPEESTIVQKRFSITVK